MRLIKKRVAALVSEDAGEGDLVLSAVALAYASMPHTATGFSPFFLLHGRKAVLPVQQYLDEPRLDSELRRWHSRFWKARVNLHERHATESKEWLVNSNALLPVGTIVAVKLNMQDKAEYPNKFGPSYMGP